MAASQDLMETVRMIHSSLADLGTVEGADPKAIQAKNFAAAAAAAAAAIRLTAAPAPSIVGESSSEEGSPRKHVPERRPHSPVPMQTGSDDPEEKQEDEEDDDDDDDDAPPAVEEQVQQPQPVVSKKLPVSLPQPMFHGIKLPSTSTSTSTTTAATAGVRVPRPSSHPEYVKPPKDDEDEDINEDDEEDDEDEADQAAAASAAASAATRRPISIGKGKMAGKGYRHSNTDRLNVAAPRGKTAAPILRHQFRYKKPHLEACISRPFTRRMAYGVGMKMISKEMCGVLRPLARHYLACVTKDALLLMNHSKRKTITSADVIMAMARHPIGSRVYT